MFLSVTCYSIFIYNKNKTFFSVFFCNNFCDFFSITCFLFRIFQLISKKLFLLLIWPYHMQISYLKFMVKVDLKYPYTSFSPYLWCTVCLVLYLFFVCSFLCILYKFSVLFYSGVSHLCKPSAILATNTLRLSTSDIVERTVGKEVRILNKTCLADFKISYTGENLHALT